MTALLDYLGGTFSGRSEGAVLNNLAPYVESWVHQRGQHGYTDCWAAEGFRVYYGGHASGTVYVQVSGEGCRIIEGSAYFKSWSDVLTVWKKDGYKSTRIDLAFDDREGVLNVSRIVQKAIAGEFTSRYAKVKPLQEWSGGELVQDGVRFGGVNGGSALIIYDKRLERLARGYDDPGTWARCELRFYDDQAEQVADRIREAGSLEGLEGYLAGAITFREVSADTNKSRWSVSDFWIIFLADAEKCRNNRVRQVISLQRMAERWVRQHAPTLAMLVCCFCEGRWKGPWLDNVIYQGWGRMNHRQCAIIREALGYVPGKSLLLPEGGT